MPPLSRPRRLRIISESHSRGAVPVRAGFPSTSNRAIGRGAHLVERDLLDALESGQISNAILDVLPAEPLSENHAFREHPGILIIHQIDGSALAIALGQPPTKMDRFQTHVVRSNHADARGNRPFRSELS
jgi:hypothetical protein